MHLRRLFNHYLFLYNQMKNGEPTTNGKYVLRGANDHLIAIITDWNEDESREYREDAVEMSDKLRISYKW